MYSSVPLLPQTIRKLHVYLQYLSLASWNFSWSICRPELVMSFTADVWLKYSIYLLSIFFFLWLCKRNAELKTEFEVWITNILLYVKRLDLLINQNHRHQQNHSLSQRSICLFNYPSHWVAKENLQGFKATWVWRKWRVVVTQQVEWGVVGGADKGHFLASSGQWEELCPVVFILHYELMLHCPHSAKKKICSLM